MKTILSIVLVFVLGAAGIALAMQRSYTEALDKAAHEIVATTAITFAQLEEADTAKLSAALRSMLTNDTYRGLYTEGDREGLYAVTSPVFDDLKKDFQITHWYFETTETSPTVFLRVHRPEQYGDALKRKTYKAAVESKGYGAGLELGKTAVALRVVHPYYAEDGTTLIGYMELGQEIDQFLEQIKRQTGDDTALMLLKEPMDEAGWADYRKQKNLENNWADAEDFVVAAATTEEAAEDANTYDEDITALPDEGDVVGTFDEGGLEEVRGIIPVKDVEGTIIGALYVEHDITVASAALMQERLLILGFVLLMLVIVTAIIIVLMDRLIFRRLNGMIEGMEDISTRLVGGDFDVHYATDARNDEIGHFEDFFSRFIDTIAGAMKQITGGK